MRFKYSLLSTFLFLTSVCANSMSFANGCDDMVVSVHNNTANPVFLDYHTEYATPAIREGVLIAAGETAPLKKIINVGSQRYTAVILGLTSANTANQEGYVYATNDLHLYKDYSSFGSQGSVITQRSYPTVDDYRFQIGYSHGKQSICSNDANQAKPGEVTVEISSIVKQEHPRGGLVLIF